jgi:tubulin--tyrosine ligase
MYNKVEDSQNLTTKKALFLNMCSYYDSVGKNPFEALPLTFHLINGVKDQQYEKFQLVHD